MVVVIFNLSFNAIVAAGIAPTTGGLPTPSTGYVKVNWPTLSTVAKSSGCTTNSTSWTCNSAIQLATQFWNTALTFGVFLWGVVNLLPVLAQAILLPGQFMAYYGIPNRVIDIYDAAFAILLLYFSYVLWSGRYNAVVE
jgi:hypothetical protein